MHLIKGCHLSSLSILLCIQCVWGFNKPLTAGWIPLRCDCHSCNKEQLMKRVKRAGTEMVIVLVVGEGRNQICIIYLLFILVC